VETIPYTANTVDADENLVEITVPVIPARQHPPVKGVSSLTPRARAYKAEREQALSEVTALIELGFQKPHTNNIGLQRTVAMIKDYSLTTYQAVLTEFTGSDAPKELIEFISRNFVTTTYGNGYAPPTDISFREAAVFGRQFPHVRAQMLRLLLDDLRTSYPAFAYEDLTELRGKDAEAFMSALSFTVAVFDFQSKFHSDWKQFENKDWTYYNNLKEAHIYSPRFTPEFITLLIERPDRHNDIFKYLWLTVPELLKIDTDKVISYLDAPELRRDNPLRTVKSAITDTRLLLGSYARFGYEKLGLKR
jgi:hypothetical protein